MFWMSIISLDSEHCTEHKSQTCVSNYLYFLFFRYFNRLVKNEADLLPPPFKIHGEKLIKTLLQYLEKV
jgi:hypothetical protein